LLITLSEKNEEVVKCVEKIILKYYTLENINNKPNYSIRVIPDKSSLKTNLNVVLESNKFIQLQTKKLLNEILKLVEQEQEREREKYIDSELSQENSKISS